jgi:RimJ/RimL family protein N-acetyltransferase
MTAGRMRHMGWLPDGFVTPDRMDLPTGHHLRPIREADVDIDLLAVMGSRERLWARYGEAWGWPPATMTYEEDREDLAHHEREIAAQESFNYAVLDEAETELLGCVYIDPPEAEGLADAEAVVSWWVVDAHAGGPLEHALDVAVPRWLADVWGFGRWALQPPQGV